MSRRWGISRGTGGLPGIDVHVGAWQAIEDHLGDDPTTVTGASAGAVVSALQAAGRTAADAVQIVRGLRSEDLVSYRRFWQPRVFWLDCILDPEPVHAVLTDLLPATMLDCQRELLVSTTWMNPVDHTPVVWRNGFVPLPAVVQASTCIPGIWPYTHIHGPYPHSDGGCSDAVVTPDDIASYDLWIHIEPTRHTDYRKRDRNVVSRLLWAYEALSRYCVSQERAALRAALGDRLLWIEVDLGESSMLDFDHSLIERSARRVAAELKLQGY